MAAFAEPRRRRWLLRLGLLALVLAFAVGATLWQAVALSSVSAVQSEIERLSPALTAGRWLAIGLVGVSWPFVTRCLHRGGRLTEVGRAALLAARWRAVAWLALIELVLGEDLIGRFVVALTGAPA